jgi:hypothetical protein
VIEPLSSKCEALSSNPGTAKTKQNRKPEREIKISLTEKLASDNFTQI